MGVEGERKLIHILARIVDKVQFGGHGRPLKLHLISRAVSHVAELVLGRAVGRSIVLLAGSGCAGQSRTGCQVAATAGSP